MLISIADILANHNLKRTSCREGIIKVVMDSSEALSENEIRDKLAGNYDRTTFYRSFKTLVEKEIIHKIVIENQLVKYALSTKITKKEDHVHFYCNECHRVKCMETVPVALYVLPEGYTSEDTEVLIKGVCDKCKKSLKK